MGVELNSGSPLLQENATAVASPVVLRNATKFLNVFGSPIFRNPNDGIPRQWSSCSQFGSESSPRFVDVTSS